MNNKSLLNNNWYIIVILTVYTILAFLLLRFFLYNIAGDEISYINIANAYSAGHWENAINGYWSPLYSWLMTPFFYILGFKPLFGVFITKILSITIGFFTILAVSRLARIFKIEKIVYRAMLISLIIPIILFVLLYNTPDLLLVLLLILYLSLIYDPEYKNKLSYGLLCGIIGALAYLTKSYAFPFFLVHFVLFNILQYTKSFNIEKKTILKNLLIGLTVFFIISGLWIGTISTKYDKLTISTSGEYNLALVGPEYRDNAFDSGISPLYSIGLIKPPNNDTTSIWGDLSYFKMNKWGPFDSWKNFHYEINLIISNIIYTFHILESFMFIAIIILVVMILMRSSSKIECDTKNKLNYLLITMFIYMGGYCLIVPEWRYLWFIFILLTMSSFIIIDGLYKSHLISINIRNIFLILLICSFIFQPTLQISHFANQKYVYYNITNELKLNYNIEGNIASNNWDGTSSIAYYLNTKYYGGTKKTNNTTEINQELINNDINYYFVWNDQNYIVLKDYHELLNNTGDGLVIYQRNK